MVLCSSGQSMFLFSKAITTLLHLPVRQALSPPINLAIRSNRDRIAEVEHWIIVIQKTVRPWYFYTRFSVSKTLLHNCYKLSCFLIMYFKWDAIVLRGILQEHRRLVQAISDKTANPWIGCDIDLDRASKPPYPPSYQEKDKTKSYTQECAPSAIIKVSSHLLAL